MPTAGFRMSTTPALSVRVPAFFNVAGAWWVCVRRATHHARPGAVGKAEKAGWTAKSVPTMLHPSILPTPSLDL
jgi:hypothetical protein